MTTYPDIRDNQELTEHQKSVLSKAITQLLPSLQSDRSPSYIRNVWRSAGGPICIAIEEIRPAQFQDQELGDLPNLQNVWPAERQLTITFKDYGTEYKVFLYEQLPEEVEN